MDGYPGVKRIMYQVQLWNDTTKTVEYHSVSDAIDYEDAQHVIQEQYPNQKVIAVTKQRDAEEVVEKPVEN